MTREFTFPLLPRTQAPSVEMDPETRKLFDEVRRVFVELHQLKYVGSIIGFLWSQYAHGTPGDPASCVFANYIRNQTGAVKIFVAYPKIMVCHGEWRLIVKMSPEIRKVVQLFDEGILTLLETPSQLVQTQADFVLMG